MHTGITTRPHLEVWGRSTDSRWLPFVQDLKAIAPPLETPEIKTLDLDAQLQKQEPLPPQHRAMVERWRDRQTFISPWRHPEDQDIPLNARELAILGITGLAFLPLPIVTFKGEILGAGHQTKNFKQLSQRQQHFGLQRHCPLCNAHLQEFLAGGFPYPVLEQYDVIGGGQRPQVRCPICRSTDRERLIYLYLAHKTDFLRRTQPATVLHVAPERSLRQILRSQPYLDYRTADIEPGKADTAIDITQIPYPDQTFDLIICNHVLEHILDDRQAMRELHRVLHPNGVAILQVPLSLKLATTYEDPSITTPEARIQAFGQEDHVRIYGRDYGQRLESVGFVVRPYRWRIDRWPLENQEFGGYNNLYGLLEREAIFGVWKQARRSLTHAVQDRLKRIQLNA
jgi:SAM-dependent methyltransferase